MDSGLNTALLAVIKNNRQNYISLKNDVFTELSTKPVTVLQIEFEFETNKKKTDH